LSCRVNVLLATHNGERYLGEQLASLESQSHPISLVTIRDDGSTDGSLRLLQEWAVGRPKVRLSDGPNLGVTNNFFTLLQNAEEGCDYFAFCDQDDVWLPDKLERAVRTLGGYPREEPSLYCSRLELVDENLDHLGYSKIPNRISFLNALVENIVTGCTIVLNRTARSLICTRLPRHAILHDWWCYLAISSLGKVIYDARPSIKYRQHGNNQIGASVSSVHLFKRRVLRFLRRSPDEPLLSDQAVEFKRCYGDCLNIRDKALLERFLSVRENLGRRISYGAVMDVQRQSWSDTMILRALILLGRL
jgi:glycosyltransferase involved in cell wall biosynthesis